MIRIASFDIGLRNFAQYVEEVDVATIQKLNTRYKSLPAKLQRRVKGQMNDAIREILDELFMCGKRIELGVYDLNVCDDADPPYEMDARRSVIAHLESFRDVFNTCDIIVIEQQYFSTFTPGKLKKTAGTEANVKAIKIAESVMSWFLIRFPYKEVVFFGSQFKTQTLGAPDNLTKPQRKKWSIEKATDILTKRGDVYALDCMKRSKKIGKQKQDDVCDALIQCQAYKFRVLVGEF